MAERDTDVLVIGGGGAGLAAAVAAAEAGASALVLEREPAAGGKTALAMGSLTAAESTVQRRHGVEDSKAASREDILRWLSSRGRALAPDDPSVDIVVEDGAATIDWFERLGVAFSGPHPERPHQVYRMHCALPDGSAYVQALARALERLGGVVRAGCAVERLALRDDAVEVAVAGAPDALRAGAVVLAAGDYSAAVERFQPGQRPVAEPLREWARGDALALARELGAELRELDRPVGASMRFRDPPYTEPDAQLYQTGAILVDERGQRLDRDGEPPASSPAARAAPAAWMVFGGELAERMARAEDDSPWARDGWRRTGRLFICTAPGRGYDYLEDTLTRPGCARAASPEALARAVGIDPQGLAATLAALGRDGNSGLLLPIARPPFVALGPLRARLMLTDGGIRVDARLRALRADGQPIPRLFAAGNAAASVGWMGAHGYSLGWAFTSGRRAGRAAAATARGES